MSRARLLWPFCALIAASGCAGMASGGATAPGVEEATTPAPVDPEPETEAGDLPLYPSPTTEAEAEELPPPSDSQDDATSPPSGATRFMR